MVGASELWQQMRYLMPEGLLLCAGLVILLFDLVVKKGRSLYPLAMLATAGAAALALLPLESSEPLFFGMIQSDAFARYFKVFSALAGFLVVLMSMDYKPLPARFVGEYLGILVLALAAIMLLAESTNLLMIFLSLEFLSLSSYILVGFLRNDKKSKEASLKYFLFGAMCTAVMLYGFALLYGASGSLDLPAIKAAFANRQNTPLTCLAMLFILAGFGFKVAMVPFHAWVPDAYEGAPTPITAFLSVGSKAGGFAVLLRVFFTVFPGLDYHPYWLAVVGVLAVFTMTVGNVIACSQDNLKRLLGYSSIAQAGYVLLGFVVMDGRFTQPAVMIYLLAYLFMNLGAFVVVIVIANTTGQEEIDDLAGLSERSPLLAWSMFIFLLSLAGVPPLGGWIGKYYIFATLVKGYLEGLSGGNLMLWFAVALAVNSVIAAYYYFRIVKAMFFESTRERMARPVVGGPLLTALYVSLILTFAVGLWPQPFLNWVSRMALPLL